MSQPLWIILINELFSVFGDPIFWVVVSVIAIIFAKKWKDDTTRVWKAILIFILIDSVVVLALKVIFATSRPSCQKDDKRLSGPLQYSFPSGHASISFGILLLVIPFFFLSEPTTTPHCYYFFASVLVLLTCYSRIALKKHYLIDIVGGILVSIFISFPLSLWFFCE